MQLPDFITKATGFFTKAEAHFTAEEKLTQAQSRITELESSAAAHLVTIAARDATIKDLTATGATAATQIATLTTELAAAKAKANQVIADQGLTADLLPAADTKTGTQTPPATAWDKYQTLLGKDPRAAGTFYATDGDKILASRPK
jgi:uncharacterized coiled-coil protein SlyX